MAAGPRTSDDAKIAADAETAVSAAAPAARAAADAVAATEAAVTMPNSPAATAKPRTAPANIIAPAGVPRDCFNAGPQFLELANMSANHC